MHDDRLLTTPAPGTRRRPIGLQLFVALMAAAQGVSEWIALARSRREDGRLRRQ